MPLHFKLSPLYMVLALSSFNAYSEDQLLDGTGAWLGVAYGGLLDPDTWTVQNGAFLNAGAGASDYSQDLPLNDWVWAEVNNATANVGGQLVISGIARNATLNGGEMLLTGKLTGEGNDKLDYFKEGILALATDTVVKNGGVLKVYNKGTALDTQVLAQGKMYVFDDGNARNTVVENGANMYVYNTTKVSETTVKSGGTQWIYYAYTVNDVAQVTRTTIEEGGIQRIYGINSLATDTEVRGHQHVYKQATVKDSEVYGRQDIYNSAQAINSNFYNGIGFAYDGGKLLDSTVFTDAIVYIDTLDDTNGNPGIGGYANNTQVKGGSLDVRGVNSLAENSVVTSGLIHAFNGGTINNTVVNGFNSGAYIDSFSSSRGNLDIDNGAIAYMVYGENSGAYAENINLSGTQSSLELRHSSTLQPGVYSNVRIDNLINNGQVQLSQDPEQGMEQSYYHLSVGNLSGSGAFLLRTDIVGDGGGVNNVGDRVIVDGTSSGAHVLTVANNGSAMTDGTELLTVVETADGVATFSMNNVVELGGYEYKLRRTGNDWELYGTPIEQGGGDNNGGDNGDGDNGGNTGNPEPGDNGNSGGGNITTTADAGANFLNVGYLMNYAETQTLLQRMGDLRQNGEHGDMWLRGFAGKFDSLSGGKLSGFDMRYSGFQIGADKRISPETPLFVGFFMGQTHGSPSYRSGNGNTISSSVGLYSTYMANNGAYADAVVKYSNLKNKFNVKDSQNNQVTGNGSSDGLTVSLEAGHKFNLGQQNNGFYLEPQLQFSYGHQSASRITASNGLKVDLGSYESMLGRASTLFGYEVNQGDTKVNLYLKTGIVREFSGDVDYRLNGSKESHSFKGNWWNNGIGVSAQLRKQHTFYLDVDSATGHKFDQRQVNGGYRYSF